MGNLKRQIGSPRLSWCHWHTGCGILVGNKEFSVATSGSAVSQLQGVPLNMLKGKLLSVYEFDRDFCKPWERLKKRLGMGAVGSNFINLSDNHSLCIKTFRLFLRDMRSVQLRSAPFLAYKFSRSRICQKRRGEHTGTPDTLLADDPSVHEYMNACNETHEPILVLFHVTGCASETVDLDPYTLRNSETVVRNLFVQKGLLFLFHSTKRLMDSLAVRKIFAGTPTKPPHVFLSGFFFYFVLCNPLYWN